MNSIKKSYEPTITYNQNTVSCLVHSKIKSMEISKSKCENVRYPLSPFLRKNYVNSMYLFITKSHNNIDAIFKKCFSSVSKFRDGDGTLITVSSSLPLHANNEYRYLVN